LQQKTLDIYLLLCMYMLIAIAMIAIYLNKNTEY